MLRPFAVDLMETHYYGFRPDNLSRLLERTGWQVLDSFVYPLGDPIYWPNVHSSKSYPMASPRRNLRAWWKQTVYRLISPALNRLGLGSCIAIYAKKRKKKD